MASDLINAIVLLAKCQHSSEEFGIRCEEQDNHWMADWAFAISGHAAARERFADNQLTGMLIMEINYPGCPHCFATSIVLCPCGRITCHKPQADSAWCPWCFRDLIEIGAWTATTEFKAGIDW